MQCNVICLTAHWIRRYAARAARARSAPRPREGRADLARGARLADDPPAHRAPTL